MSTPRQRTPPAPSGTNPVNYLLTTVLVVLAAFSFGFLTNYLPSATTCFSQRAYNGTDLATIRRGSDGEFIYRLAVVTDLDHDSKHPTKKNTWQSFFKTGELIVSKDLSHADVHWDDDKDILLSSQIAAGGRSMELSDLKVFDGHLLTIDDRTGIVYQIENGYKDAVPWVLLNDGPGNVTKGLKGEWMTVKNKQLVVGGLGKEWTTTEGVFVNYHPMYVKFVSHSGEVNHVNWMDNYLKLRRAVGIEWPGYMIHESGQWSDVHNKWFFMPRRASKETYTEATDEFAGTDLLLITDEDFDYVQVKHVGNRGNGARGFSAFQFVPGTNDNLIAALKSEEKDGVPVASYLTVFRLSDGHVLLDEKPLKGAYKMSHDHHEGHHDHHEGHHEGHGVVTTTAAAIVKELIENATQIVTNVTKEIIDTPRDHTGHEGHDHSTHNAHFGHEISSDVDHSHSGHEMKMYFHGGSQEVILFDFWRIDSCFGLFVSCIFIFVLGAAYEGIKWFRIYLQLKESKRTQRKRAYSPAVSVSLNTPACSASSPDKVAISLNKSQQKEALLYPSNGDQVYVPTVKEPEPDDASVKFFDFAALKTKAKARSRMIQAGLYCVQITLAYFLMLIAMTYNTYLTAAVVLGAGFGHWLFALIQDSAPAMNVDTVDAVSSDACH